MFEKLLSVKKLKRSEEPVWNKLYKLNEKACEGKLELKLRPKDKYGIDDIYNYGWVKTKGNSLLIVLIKFNNDSIFLDSFDIAKSREDSVSLNNLIGALRKTYKANVLFVFELDNKEKFKLCYYPLKINKNDIKAGISSLDSKINYDYAGVSITPWIHLDAQSRTIKTALSKLNDLFEQAAKMETDEFYLQVEEILKGISSDNIISSLSGRIIEEKYSLRLFAGLDFTSHLFTTDKTLVVTYMNLLNLGQEILSECPKIEVYDKYDKAYPKIDVEDFWCALQKNPKVKKILDKNKIEDLKDCFSKNLSNEMSFTSFKDLPEGEYNKIREAAERIESYEILDGEKMELSNDSEFFLDLNVRQSVTFYEAMYLCNKKSIQDGLNPCYEFSSPKIDHNELVFDVSEINENGYRLPMVREIKEFLENESVINKSRLSDKIKILSGELRKVTLSIVNTKKYDFLPEEQLIKVEKTRKDEEQQCEESGEQWLYRVLAYGQKLPDYLFSNERKAFLQMVKNVPESDAEKNRNVQNDVTNYLNNLTSIRQKSDLSNFKNQTETKKLRKMHWQPRSFLPAQAFWRTSESQKESIILSDDCIPKKKNIDRKPASFPKRREKIEYSQEQIAALENRKKEIEEQIESLHSKMGECNDIRLFHAYEKQCDDLECECQDIKRQILKMSKNIAR